MAGKNFTVRLTNEDAEQIEQIARDRRGHSSEILRDAINLYLKGDPGTLKGVDEGYMNAQALACQIAFELVREAHEKVPTTHDAAMKWLAGRRKKAK